MEKASELLEKVAPKSKPELHAITSERIVKLAGKGLHDPKRMTDQEIRELCGSLLAHVAKRGR